MTDLSKHDKHLMAAGMRMALGHSAVGMKPAQSILGAHFAPGELEARRDELMSDPDFAEAYEAAGSAEGWRVFLARQEGAAS